MDDILPLVIPLVLINLALVGFALFDLLRPERRVRGGSKVLWAVIILFINFFGPLLYFLAGREEA